MTQQIDIYGVFVPTFGLMALASFIVLRLASRLLARAGFYRFVWHRPLFDTAFYIALLAAGVLLVQRCNGS